MDRLEIYDHIDADFAYDRRTGVVTITIPPHVVADPVKLALTGYQISEIAINGWSRAEFLADGDTIVFRGVPD